MAVARVSWARRRVDAALLLVRCLYNLRLLEGGSMATQMPSTVHRARETGVVATAAAMVILPVLRARLHHQGVIEMMNPVTMGVAPAATVGTPVRTHCTTSRLCHHQHTTTQCLRTSITATTSSHGSRQLTAVASQRPMAVNPLLPAA